MHIFKEGHSENTVGHKSIHAKESTNLLAAVNHTRVTGSLDAPSQKFSLDSAIRDSFGAAWGFGNPMPVESVDEGSGDEVHDYSADLTIKDGLTTTHDYVVPTGRTFYLHEIKCQGSSATKLDVQFGDGAAVEVFDTGGTRFHRDDGNNADWIMHKKARKVVGTVNGTTIRALKTNRDKNDDQTIYSTIIGVERDT